MKSSLTDTYNSQNPWNPVQKLGQTLASDYQHNSGRPASSHFNRSSRNYIATPTPAPLGRPTGTQKLISPRGNFSHPAITRVTKSETKAQKPQKKVGFGMKSEILKPTTLDLPERDYFEYFKKFEPLKNQKPAEPAIKEKSRKNQSQPNYAHKVKDPAQASLFRRKVELGIQLESLESKIAVSDQKVATLSSDLLKIDGENSKLVTENNILKTSNFFMQDSSHTMIKELSQNVSFQQKELLTKSANSITSDQKVDIEYENLCLYMTSQLHEQEFQVKKQTTELEKGNIFKESRIISQHQALKVSFRQILTRNRICRQPGLSPLLQIVRIFGNRLLQVFQSGILAQNLRTLDESGESGKLPLKFVGFAKFALPPSKLN